MTFHLEMRTTKLSRGSDGGDPAATARRAFGNVTLVVEQMHDVWRFGFLDTVWRDVRYSMRVLRKNLGFTTTVAMVLAVGIGVNTTICSVFSQVLFAPLQFPSPDGLYVLSSHAPSLGDGRRAASGPDFRNVREQNTVLAGVAAVIPHFSEVWTGDGEPRVVYCAAPTEQFYSVMGIKPLLGRLYTSEEYKDLRNTTLLISSKFWQTQLGADPHVIGRVLRIEDTSSVIVGVLPSLNDLYPDVDVWGKLTTEPSWDFMNWRTNKFLDVIGRLRPGVSRGVAEQQLTTVLRRAVGEPSDVQVQLTPLKQFVVGSVESELVVIMAAVAVALLVMCLNTAALILARAVKRSQEFAARVALGAGIARLRQQLFIEGLLLSSLGGALGMALADGTISFVRLMPGLALPRLQTLHLSLPALMTSLLIVGFTAFLSALLPTLTLRRLDLSSTLRTGWTNTRAASGRRLAALVIAEIALTLVLTVGAGLLLRSFIRLQDVDTGIEPSKILTAYLRTNYYDAAGYAFWRTVLDDARNVSGASAAAVSDCMPAVRVNAATVTLARQADPTRAPVVEACWVSADFVRTLGMSLLKGRALSDRDNEATPPVVLVNADAARLFFAGENPIGKSIGISYIGLGTVNAASRQREIVGVVSNARQRSLDSPTEPAVYLAYAQDETHHVLASMNLFIRADGEAPRQLEPGLRAAVRSSYPNQPLERITPMSDMVRSTLARRTYGVDLMAGFAGLTLLLSAMGIYGVVSYVAVQRTREFGIRMALGASRASVLREVARQGGLMLAVGVAFGVATSLLATRLLTSMLFETVPLDPGVFGAAVVLLGVVGAAACVVPGINASRVDPRIAMNTD